MYLEPPSVVGVLQGIFNEVREELPEPLRICEKPQLPVCRRYEGKLDPLPRKLGSESCDALLQNLHEVDLFLVVGKGPEVREGKLIKVIHEPRQAHDLDAERAYGLRGDGANAVLHRLDLAPQHGDGRPQLVRHVPHELPACLLVLFQGEGERVEPPGEEAQLVGGRHRDLDVEISPRHPVGGGGERLDGTDEPASEKEGKACRDEHEGARHHA